MKIHSELSLRLLRGRGRISSLGLTGWISLVGLILGVACLVVSMAVISGFERTLQRSVSDVTGHLQILKSSGAKAEGNELYEKVKSLEPNFVAATKVIWVESVTASKGKITGTMLQGVDPAEMDSVLSLRDRLHEGEFKLGEDPDGTSLALIGKALAQKLNLKVGDDFKVVVPLASDLDPNSFRRKVGSFRVRGILDLGKYDFDERFVVAALGSVQKLADVGDRYSGLLVRLKNYELARESSARLSLHLGPSYRIRDWKDVNENIFEAVAIERVVIFFVILIIVFAAAFNVSSSLSISVVQRYPEIGIMKAMGMRPRQILQIFSLQGILLGIAGCVGGSVLGGILCLLFVIGQRMFALLPGSVYKLDHIDLVMRPLDLIMIFAATLVICALATLAPARQGSELTPVEGLRYE